MKTKTLKVLTILSTITISSNLLADNYAKVYSDNTQERSIVIPSYSNQQKLDTLDDTIIDLSNKLLRSSRLKYNVENIAITSFVDLDQLNKTTHFGRTLGESMFDELFTRGFRVNDFRGQENLSINANGEYFITRDISRMRNRVSNGYVLVGTYSMMNDRILINARILDNRSGEVVASARSYYYSDDCRLLENCRKPREIKIVTDGCSTVSCPKPSCKTTTCNKDIIKNRKYMKISSKKSDTNRLYANINHNNKNIMTQEIAQRSNKPVSLIQ